VKHRIADNATSSDATHGPLVVGRRISRAHFTMPATSTSATTPAAKATQYRGENSAASCAARSDIAAGKELSQVIGQARKELGAQARREARVVKNSQYNSSPPAVPNQRRGFYHATNHARQLLSNHAADIGMSL
jgi:hypothetical protein